MRRGHSWILGVALAGAALAFFGTDRDQLVHSREQVAVEEAAVQADLDRIVQQAALGGYAVAHRVSIEGPGAQPLPFEAEEGCAIVAAGAWGGLRLSSLRATGVRRSARPSRSLPLHAPLTQHTVVCQRQGEALAGVQPRVALEAVVHTQQRGEFSGSSGGTLLVLVGERTVPPIVAGRQVPVERETVTRESSLGGASMNATVIFFLLALLGIIANIVLSRGSVSRDGESSLRRVSLALPSEHRSTLTPLMDAAKSGDRGAVEALRDRLVALIDEVQAARWESDRTATRRIDVRAQKSVEDLRRRGLAASSDYRSRGAGAIVFTLVLQHECELPDFPSVIRRDVLLDLLLGLLPADTSQLDRAEVLLHPVDPSQTFDEAALSQAFPELVPFDPPRPSSSA